ncbi:MAG: Wzy polymerase domain-containing protein, partial [Ramlibacter sp.]
TKWLWRRIEEIDQPATWYCLAIAIPFAVHSLLEFPFAYAYFLFPVLLLAGVLERAAGGTVLFRIGPLPTAMVLASLCAVMAWSVFEYVAIEEDFRIVRFEQLRIGRTPADHHAPDVYLYSQLGALLDGSRIEVRPGMPAADLDALRKLALRYPWTGTQFRYALALALNGQQQEAVRQLQVLRWERGEKLYGRVKAEISEMAQDRYPQLRSLRLP